MTRLITYTTRTTAISMNGDLHNDDIKSKVHSSQFRQQLHSHVDKSVLDDGK